MENNGFDYTVVDSNPSKTFDSFKYQMLDEDMTTLKNDLIVLDDSIQHQVSTYNATPSSSELALQTIYKKFSDLYGIQIGYINFKDFINDIANNNKVQRDLLQAVNAKLATTISQRTGAKLMLTIQTLIDRATDAALKQSEGKVELDPIIVGMLDKCFQWQQQLIEMEQQYGLKISDPDRFMTQLTDKINGKDQDIQDVGNIEEVTAILESLRG